MRTLETLTQDVRHALRLAIRERGFTAITVGTLAICLAANAAIFAVVNAVLLRPQPFPAPERLVTIYNAYPGAGIDRTANAVPDYFDRLRDAPAFSDLALYTWTSVTIGGDGTDAERVMGMTVTPSFLRMLGVEPVRGRLFSDGLAAGERVVAVRERLWNRLFSGREELRGTTIRVDGFPHTVVAVVPTSFGFDPETDLWFPAVFSPEERSDARRHSNGWPMIGRLAPGATIAQAQSQLDAINARNLERSPALRDTLTNAQFQTVVTPFAEDVVREARPVVLLLWGGVLLVLVIGSTNLANLTLVRATGRRHEFATRLSLGMTIKGLTRQLVTESLLISTLGGAIGLMLAWVSVQGISMLGVEALPRSQEISLDLTVTAYTFALTAVVGIALSLWPVFALWRTDLVRSLAPGRLGTSSRGTLAVRRLLVASQVAVAVVILTAAGLLVVSFERVLAVDLGFAAEAVLTGDINLPEARYDDGAALVAATDRLLTELRRLPGVVAAGVTTSIPFGQRYNDNVLLAEGHHMSPGESLMSVNQVTAGDGYFQAMGARLLTGRFLDERDGRATSRAIVIDDRLAKRFWPGQVAIGKRVYFPARLDDLTAAPPEDQWFTVVGVVAAMRLQGIAQDGDAGIFGTYFLSYRQFPQRQITFAIRTTNDPSSSAGPVRSIIREFDTNLALYDVRPMEALIDRVLMNRRTPMLLVLAFATVALLLCALGLYGVVAYEVKQRTREIAIRMAVGADRARIVRMVLRQGAAVVGMGIGVGLVGVVLAQDALRALLFEVTPLEPTVLGGIVAVVIGVGALACGVPASAAAATEPASALVSE